MTRFEPNTCEYGCDWHSVDLFLDEKGIVAAADVSFVISFLCLNGKKKIPPTYCKLCMKQIVLRLFVYF